MEQKPYLKDLVVGRGRGGLHTQELESRLLSRRCKCRTREHRLCRGRWKLSGQGKFHRNIGMWTPVSFRYRRLGLRSGRCSSVAAQLPVPVSACTLAKVPEELSLQPYLVFLSFVC